MPTSDDILSSFISTGAVTAELEAALRTLAEPAFWWQLTVLIPAAAVALWLARLATKRRPSPGPGGPLAMRRAVIDLLCRLIGPLSLWLIVAGGRAVLVELELPIALLDIAAPLAASLALVRLAIFLLRRGLRYGPGLRAWESVVTTLVWLGVALYLLGWLPAVLDGLDRLAIDIGNLHLSVLAALEVTAAVAVVTVVALWLSRLLERWAMRNRDLTPAMRLGVVKFAKLVLVVVGLLVALNVVGIDLTAITVFGGALGVGLGFGLQRIASNFISGFILLMDRSIRPGDVITVGDSFGWVQALHARYVVIRDRDGVETLIPNENLITSQVINWSYSDRKVRIKLPVQISYGDDPELAMRLMEEAGNVPRVLPDPRPVARLMGFGDNGIELELRLWILDPEEGVYNVRSAANLNIWHAFRKHGITIPFPQRDLHIKDDPAEHRGSDLP